MAHPSTLPKAARLATRSPQQLQQRDRAMRDAIRELRPVLPRRAPFAWLFQNAARGETSTGWHMLCTMLEVAIDRGIPVERVLAVPRALEAYVRQLDAERQRQAIAPSLHVLVRSHAEIDAEGDVARVHALDEESPSSLARLQRACVDEIEHLKRITQAVSAKLFHSRQSA